MSQRSESSTAAHLCVNFNATKCSGMRCGDAQISARFLFGDIIRVCAATKVTISFGNAADIVANAQGRLRFSFGSAVCESAMRRAVVKLRYTRCNYDTALCSVFMAPQSIFRLKWAYKSAMQCDMAAVRPPLDGSQRIKAFNA